MKTRTFLSGFFILLTALLFGQQVWNFLVAISGDWVVEADMMQISVPLVGKMYYVLKHTIISLMAMLGGKMIKSALFGND